MLVFVKDLTSCFHQSCVPLCFQSSNVDFECYSAEYPSGWLVEKEEDMAHDQFSFLVNISFYHTISFYHFGQEEGQKILSWSIIQRQFISAFRLSATHAPKGSGVGKANFSHLIFGSAFSACLTAWHKYR